ncbi:MAG: zf-HC2 domain-containing protein [Longimicrobiales bacterium]
MPDLDRMVGGLRCRDVLELLPEFVDGGLSMEVLGRVTEHLNGCDTCEKFGGEYGELVAFLRAGHNRAPVTSDVRTRLADRMARFWTGENTKAP